MNAHEYNEKGMRAPDQQKEDIRCGASFRRTSVSRTAFRWWMHSLVMHATVMIPPLEQHG